MEGRREEGSGSEPLAPAELRSAIDAMDIAEVRRQLSGVRRTEKELNEKLEALRATQAPAARPTAKKQSKARKQSKATNAFLKGLSGKPKKSKSPKKGGWQY